MWQRKKSSCFLSEIQLEREAYCSTQREREGELLISFLTILFSRREWDFFFFFTVVVTSWAKMKEKEDPLDHHNG